MSTVSVSTPSGEKAKTVTGIVEMNPFDVSEAQSHTDRWKEPPLEKLQEIAESMYYQGQLEPCGGRRINAEKQVEIVFGRTRANAAKLLRRGFTNLEGKFIQSPDFLLRVDVRDCSDEEALIRTAQENLERSDLTSMDMAKLVDAFIVNHGYEQKAIARILHCQESDVSRWKKLLTLPEEIQEQVHAGTIAMNTALVLLDTAKQQKVEPEVILQQTVARIGDEPVTAKAIEITKSELNKAKRAEKTGDTPPSSDGNTTTSAAPDKPEPRTLPQLLDCLTYCAQRYPTLIGLDNTIRSWAEHALNCNDEFAYELNAIAGREAENEDVELKGENNT